MANREKLIRSLAEHWQLALPDTFSRLYLSFDEPQMSICMFEDIESMLADGQLWRGMLPQFLPFGEDADENWYGFYVPHAEPRRDYPVLWWNQEVDHYTPVASSFEEFIRTGIAIGAYNFQDEPEEEAFQEKVAPDLVKALGLRRDFLFDPTPMNERALRERLVKIDPQCSDALIQLGAVLDLQGEEQRAVDYYVRASEAAPWFGDPYFLLANIYKRQGNLDRACQLFWRVLETPIQFSSNSSHYAVGGPELEGDIYEVSVEYCREHKTCLPSRPSSAKIARLISSGDAFDVDKRIRVSGEMFREQCFEEAERELLNALALATVSEEDDAAYSALMDFYRSAGRLREAEYCRRAHEME